jgi:P27 family predicted phage terminase small subunit
MVTKKKLLEFLENTDFLEVDSYLVDELLFNQLLIKQAKKDIKEKGISINVSNNPEKPYFQTNQSVTIYNNSLKNILQISRKLGLSAADRKTIGLSVDNDDDGFD